jgi:hypothetical protein
MFLGLYLLIDEPECMLLIEKVVVCERRRPGCGSESTHEKTRDISEAVGIECV